MTATEIKVPACLGLKALANRYEVVLCDVWGVVHNGVSAWESATDALTRYRENGGTVILVTNAPRPYTDVLPQLDGLGVPRSAWDFVVTSGDVTRHEIVAHGTRKLLHIGPERDANIFENLRIERTTLEEAERVVVTGLDDDDTETPDDYRELLAQVYERKLPLVCANPDRVVEKGDRILWCAGALADMYEDMGGEVVFAGKPYAPIYELALSKAEEIRGKSIERTQVLAIGDAVRTDLLGAKTFGVDSLFVAGGIHGADIGNPMEPLRLQNVLDLGPVSPIGWSRRLTWENPSE